MSAARTVLWWGRFDPDYSRNRILRQLLNRLGWQVIDFQPRLSRVADWEARLRRLPRPDLVWVPCFRQRDLPAARRWAAGQGVPVLFDPLISAYDKQVFERGKFAPDSRAARRLHERERQLFRSADLVLADTRAHADYFIHEFGMTADRLAVVCVGAEEPLFSPAEMPAHGASAPLEVLFYGSFIGLHGLDIIIEAARLCRDAPVRWTLLGDGPLLAECRRQAAGLDMLHFEPWLPYAALPGRIRQADVVLGVFDAGAKAGRVIPNKVFQALACGRPVVTRQGEAYGELGGMAGLLCVPPGDPRALADRIAEVAGQRERLQPLGHAARATYEASFSNDRIAAMLDQALRKVVPAKPA